MNLGGARAICGRGHCDGGRRLDDHPVCFHSHCDSHGDCDHESGHVADDGGHDSPGLAHVQNDVRPGVLLACLLGDDPRDSDPVSDRAVVDMARPGKEEAGMEGQLEGKAGIRAEARRILCSRVPGTPAEGCEGVLRATRGKDHVGVGALAKEADIHTAWGVVVDSWAVQDMIGEGEDRDGSQTAGV